jgi:3-methyladenine DNA glycosylase AlkD
MELEEIIEKLKSLENPKNVEGMARYGINPKNNLGVSIYILRPIAKKIGLNHDLALKLWNSGIHDARLLACFIDDFKKVTKKQMNSWVMDFDSWDVCDQVCTSLFDKTSYAWKKAYEWSEREEEFVKRAAFSLVAGLSVHDKKTCDEKFEKFLLVITKHANDERNYVKKAVNWALRNIGKRNINLNKKAIKTAEELIITKNKTAIWIAKNALKELKSEKVKNRLT